mmetsp:Transcript_70225/g.117181  ORF Transcript_70225/g.117181 Transcript_70225/m.117181 type:complete len:102 (-) Transcript_70225:51-356(-)
MLQQLIILGEDGCFFFGIQSWQDCLQKFLPAVFGVILFQEEKILLDVWLPAPVIHSVYRSGGMQGVVAFCTIILSTSHSMLVNSILPFFLGINTHMFSVRF